MSSFHHRPGVVLGFDGPGPVRLGERPPRSHVDHVRAHACALAQAFARGRARAGDAGMATAEYAIATLAAVGFAGLLLTILRSGEVKSMLTGIIKRALSVSG